MAECVSGVCTWFLFPDTRRSTVSGCSVDQSRQAKFSCQHFVSITKTAGHSSFIKSILKLLRHLPPATIEKSLRVAKLARSSLAAFTFLTFSLRALEINKKTFWDAFQVGARSTFFPSIKHLFFPHYSKEM